MKGLVPAVSCATCAASVMTCPKMACAPGSPPGSPRFRRSCTSRPRGADKIHALHEPEGDCISKGKARVRHEFGHMKSDGRLSPCSLKGTVGDAPFAVPRAGGHNLLAHLAVRLAWIIATLLAEESIRQRRSQGVEMAGTRRSG